MLLFQFFRQVGKWSQQLIAYFIGHVAALEMEFLTIKGEAEAALKIAVHSVEQNVF